MLLCYSINTVCLIEPSFENDLLKASYRSLSSFPKVKSLKAEEKFMIEKVIILWSQ